MYAMSLPAMFSLSRLRMPAASGSQLLQVHALFTFLRSHTEFIALPLSRSGPYAWQDVYDALRDAGYMNVPGKDTYGAGKNAARIGVQSNSKSLQLFSGFAYRSFRESIGDMGESLTGSGFM